jgi:hypothetical protein
MRFGNYSLNQQRTKTWFAILPVTIKGKTRWFEKVTVLQEWYAPDRQWGWYNIKFIDK